MKDSPDGDVVFGRIEHPQVIIKWSPSFSSDPTHITSKSKLWVSAPIIYLLDASLEVLLKAEPAENEGTRIEGQECHRLKGSCTTFLQRLFNEKTLVVDDDPIYAETANFAVAFAILLSRSIRRVPMKDCSSGETEIEVPTQCYLNTEQWRSFDSSNLSFWGIKLDKRTIVNYAEKLTGASITDMVLPSGIRNYLEKVENDTHKIRRDQFIEDIKQPASWVLRLA